MTFPIDPTVVAYDFTVGLSDLLITDFGIFDHDANGLYDAYDIIVWDSMGLPIANGSVPQGTVAQLTEGFRYTELVSTTRLNAGETYVIGTWYSGEGDGIGRSTSWDTTANSHFSSVGANHAIFESDSLEFPNSFDGTNPMWGPTFQYNVVPEPSTWALFLCGGVVLFVRLRQGFGGQTRLRKRYKSI